MMKKLLFTLFLSITLAPQVLAMEPTERSQDDLDSTLRGVLRLCTPGKERVFDVSELIRLGANVNAQNNHGETPLMIAAQNRNFVLCKILLEEGAIPSIQDQWRKTALHHVALYNHFFCDGGEYMKTSRKTAQLTADLCNLIIDHQRRINYRLVTGLLCLHHLGQQGNQATQLLYRYRKNLLLPYLKQEIQQNCPIPKLLQMQTLKISPENILNSKTAYQLARETWNGHHSYLELFECLNPNPNNSRCVIL